MCAYDRPGTFRYTDPLALTDRSTPVPMPRTAGQVVDDLHALLTAAAVPGPYLSSRTRSVACSRGSHPAVSRGRRGVVFVDAFPLEMPELMGGVSTSTHTSWTTVPAFAGNRNAEVVDIAASVAQLHAAPAYRRCRPRCCPDRAVPPARGTPPDIGPTLERIGHRARRRSPPLARGRRHARHRQR